MYCRQFPAVVFTQQNILQARQNQWCVFVWGCVVCSFKLCYATDRHGDKFIGVFERTKSPTHTDAHTHARCWSLARCLISYYVERLCALSHSLKQMLCKLSCNVNVISCTTLNVGECPHVIFPVMTWKGCELRFCAIQLCVLTILKWFTSVITVITSLLNLYCQCNLLHLICQVKSEVCIVMWAVKVSWHYCTAPWNPAISIRHRKNH